MLHKNLVTRYHLYANCDLLAVACYCPYPTKGSHPFPTCLIAAARHTSYSCFTIVLAGLDRKYIHLAAKMDHQPSGIIITDIVYMAGLLLLLAGPQVS